MSSIPKPNLPKMSRKQAKILWNSLTPLQKQSFNEMIKKMQRGELKMSEIKIDDNEQIQNITLENKEKPISPEMFYKYFKT